MDGYPGGVAWVRTPPIFGPHQYGPPQYLDLGSGSGIQMTMKSRWNFESSPDFFQNILETWE